MPHSITSTISSDTVYYFKETLEDCDIYYGKTRYKITKAPPLIIRELEKWLNEHENFPHNVLTFSNSLRKVCEDKAEFSKVLMPMECESAGTKYMEQESILRILLNIGCLQNDVIEMLLDHLTTLACDSNDNNVILGLILKVLRFLPFINEPAQFTTKILDLIEISNINMQRELLHHIPELIPDNQYDEAAKQLSKLLEDCDDLSGSIIDCVNSFNISADTRVNIREHIMKQLLTSTRYYKIFPILFEFLLTDCKQENVQNVLLKSRITMDNIMRAESSESDSYKVLTFKKLEYMANDEKYLFAGFVNMIGSVKESSEHRPVDVLVLFMLHSVCKGKRNIVEAIFKKQIKNSLFKVVLFERVFEKYFAQQIFSDYFTSMLEISDVLLKMQDDAAIMIAVVMYKLLFTNQYCSRPQRQDILYNLMMIMGIRDFKNASVALKVIRSLLETNTIKEHAVQLMNLLEKVDVLDLNDVKQLFDILCLVMSDESGLKDELYMHNRKQLLSYERVIKQKGIVSAVILAKHVASINEVQTLDQNISIDSIECLPDGPAKKAATILQAANQSALGLPEMLALYYDQLSSMIVSAPNLDPIFLSWLFETTKNDFETIFIVDSPPPPINDLKLTAKYTLNTTDSQAVNIGEMAIKEKGTIIILAPLFKLLRLLHYKQNNGNLLLINPLIGFPVIMPEYDNIDNLHIDQIKQVADCIYHCINWFRELISAFCTQSLKPLRSNVISRLMELIQLEEALQECMEYIPDHKLPTSYVDLSPQTNNFQNKRESRGITKTLKKKFKSAEAPPSTSTSDISNVYIRQKKTEFNFKFRDMDTDIIVLLKYPLTLSVFNSQTQSTTLHLKQFKFLLKDLKEKLDKLSSFSDLHVIDPINLITDCLRFIPMIQKQSVAIVHEIENLLHTVDGRYDVAEMFTEEVEDLNTSYNLILEFYSVLFRWSGFQHAKQQTLLKDCLKRLHTSEPSQSFKYSINFINDICKSTDQCLLLSSAVRMIEIMQALYNIQTDPEIRRLIVITSGKFLKRNWFNSKGKQALIHIDKLVKAYLSNANLKTVSELVRSLQDEAPNLKSRDDYLLMLGSIDKSNFHILYRGLCVALSDRVKAEVAVLTNNEHLTLWKITFLTMQGLMTIAKIQNSKSNLCYFLKKSISILKIFISRGIPIMEIMLRLEADRVLEIFKIMQTSTRFLHHVCCYSKNAKDSILMSQVPQFRLVLETLVYHVKAILIANNCSEAFWMGNLKNRDLQGYEILSQSTVTDSASEEEEFPFYDSNDDDPTINDDGNQEVMGSEEFDLEF